MADTERTSPSFKPKTLIVDRKYKPEDLRIPRNQQYVRDLGQCFKIFQKWSYDIIWVENGADALRALREYPDMVKTVIIEAYIPGGGFTVARLIRFKPDCKHIPVFIMSRQITQVDVDEGHRIGVFECLMRPFTDIAFLESRLKKGGEEQSEVAEAEKDVDPREHILRELEKITGLPAMPTVYNEVQKLSRDPEATTDQYSQIIELDPGITAQMLRLCNSSAFSFTRQITSVGDAVNLLGLQTVIDFVRTLSVVGAFKDKSASFDTQKFWEHSIACGTAAKILMERPEFQSKLDLGEEDPLMAGMVHDIGKQVLGHFFNEMYQMVLPEVRSGKTMFQVEEGTLGITHQDIGDALATKWKLPEDLTHVIGSHHAPRPDDEDMVYLVHLANECSKQVGYAFEEKTTDISPSEGALEKMELDAETLGSIFKELESKIREHVRETFSAIFR